MSLQTVSRWEKGKDHPRGPSVFRLAEVLRISADDLLADSLGEQPIAPGSQTLDTDLGEHYRNQNSILAELTALRAEVKTLRAEVRTQATEPSLDPQDAELARALAGMLAAIRRDRGEAAARKARERARSVLASIDARPPSQGNRAKR